MELSHHVHQTYARAMAGFRLLCISVLAAIAAGVVVLASSPSPSGSQVVTVSYVATRPDGTRSPLSTTFEVEYSPTFFLEDVSPGSSGRGGQSISGVRPPTIEEVAENGFLYLRIGTRQWTTRAVISPIGISFDANAVLPALEQAAVGPVSRGDGVSVGGVDTTRYAAVLTYARLLALGTGNSSSLLVEAVNGISRGSYLERVRVTVFVDQQGRAREIVALSTVRSRNGGTTETLVNVGHFGVPVNVVAPSSVPPPRQLSYGAVSGTVAIQGRHGSESMVRGVAVFSNGFQGGTVAKPGGTPTAVAANGTFSLPIPTAIYPRLLDEPVYFYPYGEGGTSCSLARPAPPMANGSASNVDFVCHA